MEIPPQLRCLFSAEIERSGDSLVVEVPEEEVHTGGVSAGETYRVALLPAATDDAPKQTDSRTGTPPADEPPVEEGETRRVEIESIGDQGDGVTRVERGFVVIVPDTEVGERVAVEIQAVTENVAFAEVTERLSYYD
ncbi:TRAM domain-containing protein [Haloarcula nitratireducens]|uniref:TRAM domain-containing protein n=1 Tax=Haloarcula nitratireducens TaxID=2487749 RepID=A0AAW4PDX9_9EURY|nr:TRAM domain-containing protein [Halomicroarcula nitratireducens]MBX0296192.1 TRAM domain-containing protein [Halomicroarcula nitratireducens]